LAAGFTSPATSASAQDAHKTKVITKTVQVNKHAPSAKYGAARSAPLPSSGGTASKSSGSRYQWHPSTQYTGTHDTHSNPPPTHTNPPPTGGHPPDGGDGGHDD
jgi:hypothetical protein